MSCNLVNMQGKNEGPETKLNVLGKREPSEKRENKKVRRY